MKRRKFSSKLELWWRKHYKRVMIIYWWATMLCMAVVSWEIFGFMFADIFGISILWGKVVALVCTIAVASAGEFYHQSNKE